MELRACLSDVEDHVNREAEYRVSPEEIQKFRSMVELFHGWLCDMALIDEYGDLDEQALEAVCRQMALSADEMDEEEDDCDDDVPVASPVDMDDDDYDWDEHDEEG